MYYVMPAARSQPTRFASRNFQNGKTRVCAFTAKEFATVACKATFARTPVFASIAFEELAHSRVEEGFQAVDETCSTLHGVRI